jgi:hypothetical protein
MNSMAFLERVVKVIKSIRRLPVCLVLSGCSRREPFAGEDEGLHEQRREKGENSWVF